MAAAAADRKEVEADAKGEKERVRFRTMRGVIVMDILVGMSSLKIE